MPIWIDIDSLSARVSADCPSGDDLEYTPDFAALVAAATGKPLLQVGDTIVPAIAPDWPHVLQLAAGLLTRTRDLRVASRLTQALLHVGGLGGLRDGLVLISRYIDAHWESLYPGLDAEDGFDPSIRVNALAVLCHPGAIVGALRVLPLLRSAMGRPISLEAIAQVHGGDAPAVSGPDAGEIAAAFAMADRALLETLVSDAQQARDAALTIERGLGRHAGAAQALDFEPLKRALADIHAAASQALAARPRPKPPVPGADAPVPEMAATPTPAAPMVVDTPLRGRADVLRGLDAMCRYFTQHEPSHPVPILLARARRWIEMDFMDLLRDLAPEAVGEAEKLRGASHAD